MVRRCVVWHGSREVHLASHPRMQGTEAGAHSSGAAKRPAPGAIARRPDCRRFALWPSEGPIARNICTNSLIAVLPPVFVEGLRASTTMFASLPNCQGVAAMEILRNLWSNRGKRSSGQAPIDTIEQ